MQEQDPKPILRNHQEELEYLRGMVRDQEHALMRQQKEAKREDIVHERVVHYNQQGDSVHSAEFSALSSTEARTIALDLDPESDDETMEELRVIMETRGIQSAFAVLEKLANPHLSDDFHRFLVAYILAGYSVRGVENDKEAWHALHMTLYQVALPEVVSQDDKQEKGRSLRELISNMEQFYAGMLTVEDAYANEPPYMTLELAVPNDKPNLYFYIAVPRSRASLFEKQLLAIYPTARIAIEKNDYNVFTQEGTSLGSYATLKDKGPIPIKDYADFDYDPLNTILNAFAKIQQAGEGAAIQIVFKPKKDSYMKLYKRMLKAIGKGEDKDMVFSMSDDFWPELWREFKVVSKETISESSEKKGGGDPKLMELIEKKISAPVVETNLRIVTSAGDAGLAKQTLEEIESSFNQFEHTRGNKLKFTRPKGPELQKFFKEFSYRVYSSRYSMPLSLRELTTLYHFPPKGITSSPHLEQARFKSSDAPYNIEKRGILLGHNTFRGLKTDIYMDGADRMRHMYVVGQTGTGKTVFLKNLIMQDIKAGHGVCFIDPHGEDILEVLGSIPPERFNDVIYFDPANVDRPLGLNMLEYDPRRPEQKSFIVNELLSIFQQLYGAVPESMGPAFEQYFRNATQLVMEDPDSGSTMADIPRVMTDSYFRNQKLAKSKNVLVNQFWTDIATQVDGENKLENIVPYITNKFDEFLANDFMRPIMGQQKSSFNFRELIDNKKILLVNLSKGRLGERNANMLGLIIVGKIFMAALGRSDNPRADLPPFYLYIDEFQNITTKTIPSILSEARKYKLSLTIAHQYVKQIDEKIRDAVFGNVGSMVVFRVGPEDGEFFAKDAFAPVFSAQDFLTISNYNAYVKLLLNNVPQKPFNIATLPFPTPNFDQIDDLRELSSLTYGRDRETVEAEIRAKFQSY